MTATAERCGTGSIGMPQRPVHTTSDVCSTELNFAIAPVCSKYRVYTSLAPKTYDGTMWQPV